MPNTIEWSEEEMQLLINLRRNRKKIIGKGSADQRYLFGMKLQQKFKKI